MSNAFINYAGSFLLAAQELAKTPLAQNDEALQTSICRKYGIFLDSITDAEAYMLSRLVEEYAEAR